MPQHLPYLWVGPLYLLHLFGWRMSNTHIPMALYCGRWGIVRLSAVCACSTYSCRSSSMKHLPTVAPALPRAALNSCLFSFFCAPAVTLVPSGHPTVASWVPEASPPYSKLRLLITMCLHHVSLDVQGTFYRFWGSLVCPLYQHVVFYYHINIWSALLWNSFLAPPGGAKFPAIYVEVTTVT